MTYDQQRKAAAHMRNYGSPFYQHIGAAWINGGPREKDVLVAAFALAFATHAGGLVHYPEPTD